MTDGFIPVPGTNPEKKLHTKEVLIDGQTLEDEVVYVANLPTAAFGELSIAESVPITQITAVNGITNKVETFIQGVGGSTTTENGMFLCDTGTASNGAAVVTSRRQAKYRAGQGLKGQYTAIFDTPAPNSLQHAGFANTVDQLGFGYKDEDFGIIYNHHGSVEVQDIQVTTPASGSENATVTIDGTGYTVPLTSGTVQHNAYEIATSLASQVQLWLFTSNGDTVSGMSLDATSFPGVFSFSSATAAATWTQVSAGANPTGDQINQADWNVDTMDGLDPTKGNVYRIQMQYLGFGGIVFGIEDRDTSEFKTVHIIKPGNDFTEPSVASPIFRMGWIARNLGNTSSIQVRGASGGLFNEGPIVIDEQPRSLAATQASIGTASFTNVITIRNRIIFNDTVNQIEVEPSAVSVVTDSAKGALVEIIEGGTLSSDLVFDYVDKATSTMEYATDAVTVTGGRLVASFVTTTLGNGLNLKELGTRLYPGQYVTISVRTISGAASDATATVNWVEDQ